MESFRLPALSADVFFLMGPADWVGMDGPITCCYILVGPDLAYGKEPYSMRAATSMAAYLQTERALTQQIYQRTPHRHSVCWTSVLRRSVYILR